MLRKFLPLMALPFLIKLTIGYFADVGVDFVAILVCLVIGLPFWLLVVQPLHGFIGGGVGGLICAISLALFVFGAAYLYVFLSPEVYSLKVNDAVLVEKGVPTSLYYESILLDLALLFLNAILGGVWLIHIARRQ